MRDTYISLSKAMKAITEEYNRKAVGSGLKLAWIEKALNTVPAEETKGQTGHWTHCGHELIGGADVYECSECKAHSRGGNYCFNCGAKMEGEEA